jgi:transposase
VEPIHERVAGMDVHRMEHVVTVLVEQEDGTLLKDTRKFGGFKRDMRALIDWLRSHRIQQVVMESTNAHSPISANVSAKRRSSSAGES